MRELSHLINEDPSNLSRELKRLEDEGLYTSMIKGSLKFFSLYKRYPLFKELKKIIFKTEGVQGSLKDLLQRMRGLHWLCFMVHMPKMEKERLRISICRRREVPPEALHPRYPSA